jgi:D-alanyl-lipoteichoic acid acyltransferase DltB (MBOAT superfamily)
MVFNSLGYFLFLPVVFLIHHFSPARFRWLVLLVASFAFYAALQAPHLILILLVVTGVTYGCGLRLHRCTDEAGRRRILWSGIIANALVLVILKYLSFLTDCLNTLLKLAAPGTAMSVSAAVVTIGVSYFVFQAISYLVDIYLEKIEPERHFGYFVLFMGFFPKLLQGPIERGGTLLPQLRAPYRFDYANARSGLVLFAWGLFKKVVIADRLALLVDGVYGNVYAYRGGTLLVATYCFALQLYFDFSGYTDMALGTARLFNIELTQNFNRPYLATSVAEFWRRWHISFSSWILEYIFKPLQFSFRDSGKAGAAVALLVTFFISGVWHGSKSTFIVWGCLHGLYLATAVVTGDLGKKLFGTSAYKKTRLYRLVKIVVTFNLVSFAWIFFRVNDLSDAAYIVVSLASAARESVRHLQLPPQLSNELAAAVANVGFEAMLLALASVLYLAVSRVSLERLLKAPAAVRWGFYQLLLVTVFAVGIFAKQTAFIYFQF